MKPDNPLSLRVNEKKRIHIIGITDRHILRIPNSHFVINSVQVSRCVKCILLGFPIGPSDVKMY